MNYYNLSRYSQYFDIPNKYIIEFYTNYMF